MLFLGELHLAAIDVPVRRCVNGRASVLYGYFFSARRLTCSPYELLHLKS